MGRLILEILEGRVDISQVAKYARLYASQAYNQMNYAKFANSPLVSLDEALFDNGTGVVVLHHALLSYQTWPEYERIAGGKYLLDNEKIGDKITPPSTYQGNVNIDVKLIAKDHPNGKIAVLYENDEYGAELLAGLERGLGRHAGADRRHAVVREPALRAGRPRAPARRSRDV